MARPVLIDTDTGVDDALALILALRSPEISVEAITTVAGNVEVDKCTRNVSTILRLLRLPHLPVVAQGAARPLVRELFTAPEVHGRDGLGNTQPKVLSRRSIHRNEAVDVIYDLCKKYEKRLTIVALGPLTNLALALKKYPAAVKKAGHIVSMGGAFRVPGNTGPVAEFNYFVDPEAAQCVLDSGIALTMIPLDLTEQIVLMRSEVEYRAKRRASTLASFIARLTKYYMRYHRQTEGFDGGYLHDPIAVSAAIEPAIVQSHAVTVHIETSGKLTRGMTVADFRKSAKKGDRTVDVAFKIDKERFLKLFHERLWM